MSDVYTKWLREISSEWPEDFGLETIKLACEEIKFDGFNLDDIARQLAGVSVDKLIKLLSFFHSRGSKPSVALKTIKESSRESYAKLMKDCKVCDSGSKDRKAITLPRISLALPVMSVGVALQMMAGGFPLGIHSSICQKGAIFGVNSVVTLCAHALFEDEHEAIWKNHIIMNVAMYYRLNPNVKITAEITATKVSAIKMFSKLTYSSATKTDLIKKVKKLWKNVHPELDIRNDLVKMYLIDVTSLNECPGPLF